MSKTFDSFVQFVVHNSDGTLNHEASLTALTANFNTWFTQAQQNYSEMHSALSQVLSGGAQVPLARLTEMSRGLVTNNEDWDNRVRTYVLESGLFTSTRGRHGGVKMKP